VSIRLSVPARAHSSRPNAAGLLLWVQQAGDINRLLQQQLANVGSVTTTILQPFNGLFSRTTWVSRYQKGKPIWILLEQETVSGSGISWVICKSAPRSRQITTPVSHRSIFLQAGCPSCRPTNSVKALKAVSHCQHM